jgi:hypothetical protein
MSKYFPNVKIFIKTFANDRTFVCLYGLSSNEVEIDLDEK